MVTLVQVVASPHPHGLQPSPSIYPALIFITLINTFLKKCLYCHILSSQINFLRAGIPVLQDAWGAWNNEASQTLSYFLSNEWNFPLGC